MAILLNDYDKLIIIATAVTLIMVTLLMTICFVCPWCYLYQWIMKSKQIQKTSTLSYPSLNQNAESQHFHFSIVPVYGTKNQTNCSPTKKSVFVKQPYTSMNQFEHLTNLAEKTRIRYTFNSKNNNNNNTQMNFSKIEAAIYYKLVSESNIRIYIKIKRVYDLVMNELINEPSPYVIVILSGYRVHKKNIAIKAVQNELFRTETIKRSLDATFHDQEFVSEELPKNLIKEANIKLRLMNEERYANDVCLGELSIPLKKISFVEDIKNDYISIKDVISNTNVNDDLESTHQYKITVYTIFPIKEIKGELLVGFCYLPTSGRVNITIVKGNIRNSILRIIDSTTHQAFYIKALMFYNGKLIKKKKTSLSIRLLWGKDETISFDLLPDESSENMSLMLILAYKMQNSSSPESPETPENPTASSSKMKEIDEVNEQLQSNHIKINSKTTFNNVRKDSCIGHFILDKTTWREEIMKKPRKQMLKWYKLY